MNVRFNYLYRDAGNYKNYGDIVFANKNSHDESYLEKQVRNLLIYSEFFVAEKTNIPTLYFDKQIPELDHGCHQFDSFETCDDSTTDQSGRDITEFLSSLEEAHKEYIKLVTG